MDQRASLRAIVALVILGSFPMTKAVTEDAESTPHLKQNLQCQTDLPSCPEFLSEEQWDKQTADCCGEGSGLTLHVQRMPGAKGCGIFACLPTITCQAGKIPIIHEYQEGVDRYAYLKCEPCSDDSFEPTPRKSYHYGVATCRFRHQTCSGGKTLVRGGNASHDTMCRCSWERGFSPSPSNSLCASPDGFDGNAMCDCFRFDCQEDMQLNHEFKCVPKPSTQEPQSDFSTAHEEGRTVKTTTAQPTVPEEKKEDIALEDVLRIVYGIVVTAVLLLAAALLMYHFHP